MSPITLLIVMVLATIGAAPIYLGYLGTGIVLLVCALDISLSMKMANTWPKFVVLCAGNRQGVGGPGSFKIVPATAMKRAQRSSMTSGLMLSVHGQARQRQFSPNRRSKR